MARPKPKLVFAPVKHKYYLDLVEMPSVTTILKSLGFYPYLDKIPADRLEFKRQVGNAIHKMTHLYDTGQLSEASLVPVKPTDLDLRPFLAQWQRFKEYLPYEMLRSEVPLCSAKHRFAGTPDRVVKIKGKLAIIDLKTTHEISPVVALQTAGYAILAEETFKKSVPLRYAVHLKEDGVFNPKTDLVQYQDNKGDRNGFLCCLQVMNRKTAYGISY